MTPLNPPSESGTSQQLFQALKLLLLQGVLWFIGVQLLIGVPRYLEASTQEYLTSKPIDYASLLTVYAWDGLRILIWSIPLYAVITWLLFRSRFRMVPQSQSLWRWVAGVTLFPVLGVGLWRSLNRFGFLVAPPLMWLSQHASFGLAKEQWGWIAALLCMAIVGSLASALMFFEAKIQLRVFGLILISILVPGTLIFGMTRLVSEFRDWRAQPGLNEYAVYEAIARRNTKRHGIATQVVRECGIQFNDVSGELIRALGAEGAFRDYQKRQRRGCRVQRAFEPGSQLLFFPNGAMSPNSLGAFIEAHQEPMLIEIFSRVGFSPDGARAYLSRISLVQWHDSEYGRQATISNSGTTLTKADGSWEVDYGFEPDEWGALDAKRTEAERKASIQAMRTLRGLWSAP